MKRARGFSRRRAMARPKETSSRLPKRPRDPAGAAILLAATPFLIGGAVALAVTVAGGSSLAAVWLKSMLGRGGYRARAMRDCLRGYAQGNHSFPSLRSAILGSAKGAVLSVFGPPRTALLGRGASRLSIWRADTWYYPLERPTRSAMAIRFDRNVAREVERVSAPREVTSQ